MALNWYSSSFFMHKTVLQKEQIGFHQIWCCNTWNVSLFPATRANRSPLFTGKQVLGWWRLLRNGFSNLDREVKKKAKTQKSLLCYRSAKSFLNNLTSGQVPPAGLIWYQNGEFHFYGMTKVRTIHQVIFEEKNYHIYCQKGHDELSLLLPPPFLWSWLYSIKRVLNETASELIWFLPCFMDGNSTNQTENKQPPIYFEDIVKRQMRESVCKAAGDVDILPLY